VTSDFSRSSIIPAFKAKRKEGSSVQPEIQNVAPSRSEIGMTLVIPEASHSGGNTSGCCHLPRLQFRLLRKSQCVIDLDPEVAHRAFQLGMAEQELDSS
jgi:hypothetical protein